MKEGWDVLLIAVALNIHCAGYDLKTFGLYLFCIYSDPLSAFSYSWCRDAKTKKQD